MASSKTRSITRRLRGILGGASLEEIRRLHKWESQRLEEVVKRGERRAADTLQTVTKRMDRVERSVETLAENIENLEKALRKGILRKLEGNVDALVRHTFLGDRALPPPHDLLTRRFRMWSQNEEDGITLALLDRIGPSTTRFVEIGAGANGGNSGFLARECGWTGVMFEVDADRVRVLQRRFGPAVTAVVARVTRENIDDLLRRSRATGDVDLLSIDIDGNDYWVWERLSACNPRLVIVEYNRRLGVDRPLVVPYDPDFDRHRADVPRAYYGASLPAFVRLAARKNYRLVTIEPRGVNAFFVRNDVGADVPALTLDRAPVADNEDGSVGPGGLLGLIERKGLKLVEIA